MTLVESIRALLVNAGITDVYIIDAPESTLDSGAVVIIPYSSDSEEYLPVGTQYLQVRASAATFPASEALCWEAFHALNDLVPEGSDRRCLSGIVARQEPFFLGKDGARYIHEFNVQITAQWKETEGVDNNANDEGI